MKTEDNNLKLTPPPLYKINSTKKIKFWDRNSQLITYNNKKNSSIDGNN